MIVLSTRRTWLAGALALALAASGCGSGGKKAPPSGDVTVDVSAVFPAGTALRDGYSGAAVAVGADGRVTVTPPPEGVVLLERDGAAPTPFRWKNAVVYFVMTDRFFNGDPSNDGSYGRQKDGAQEVGTWHGGDWKGLTEKLDHIEDLGATAIWITPIVEQVHGWVVGGSGSGFRHHAYHGYYALDFTRLDQNYGSLADLQELVRQAHARGIRVLFDVVLNHPGYATGDDLLAYLPEVFVAGPGGAPDGGAAYQAWAAGTGQDLNDWHDFVNYGAPAWAQWWGVNWIRAGLGGGYQGDGGTDETNSLSFLPDFKTEDPDVAGLPPFLAPGGAKEDTGATEIAGGTVRDHLVKWHADWVRATGADGFRCDTVKNVERASWRALKDAATAALAEWKAANPGEALDDAPFWMTGEVFGHGVSKDSYYTEGGFDSLINFSFQDQIETLLVNEVTLVDDADRLSSYYRGYSNQLAGDPAFDVLSYVSSHDTRLFYERFARNAAKQRDAGTALLLAPGGVQVYYGDETGRPGGPGGGDSTQGTRSGMNWSSVDPRILSHWSKLANFRKRHAAVGAGVHARLESPAGTLAFSRTLDEGGVQDEVVVILARPR